MASESSSAVLELTDADGDETEAPSVADVDERDDGGAPLIMEHGADIAVKVDAPLKQLSTLETFVTYRVRCVCARWPAPPNGVRRRYNHFKVLHRRLCSAHEWLAVPPLPPLHSARQQLDRYSPAFVAIRTLALNAFLDRVAKHPILTHSEDFRLFLTTPDEELEKVFRSESGAHNLWGLSSALSNNDNKHANGARVKDPEFTSAADYLQCLQQKLTTLCSLTTKLHKGSTELATEFVGMKRACDAWCSQTRGGRLARAVGGLGAGAGAAGAALGRARPPLRARASLPLLAAYAGALQEKIRQRDAIHAVHVSEAAGREDNRLALASEALRSDLADWTPKTRAEVKRELLDLATKRVTSLTQILMGWEHALKLSTEANVDELFKTVSKTAVQNLSPSKCKPDVTPTETERDFDDLDNYSDLDLPELDDKQTNMPIGELHFDSACPDLPQQQHPLHEKNGVSENFHNDDKVISDPLSKNEGISDPLSKNEDISDLLLSKSEVISDPLSKIDVISDPLSKNEAISDPLSKIDVISDPLSKNELITDPLSQNEVISDPLSKNEVIISDPLQSFSEIDLSS
ncbi:hypothetical protein O0L34_g11968 [Tuta absoluta]|nr:hypothetical protein O0L34_g11968 [Tuta absoluta]